MSSRLPQQDNYYASLISLFPQLILCTWPCLLQKEEHSDTSSLGLPFRHRKFRCALARLPNSSRLNQTADCKLSLTCINTTAGGAPWQYRGKRKNILQELQDQTDPAFLQCANISACLVADLSNTFAEELATVS